MKMLLCLCLGLVQELKPTASNLKFLKARTKCNPYDVCAEHRQVTMPGSFFSLFLWLIFWKQRAFYPGSLDSTSTAWKSSDRCEAKLAFAIAGTAGGWVQIVKMQKWSEGDSKNQSILHHGECFKNTGRKDEGRR